MKEIKVAVLGIGRIGKRHCKMLQRLKNFKLVATIDPVAESIPGIAHYTALETFCESDKQADLVVICTPNGFHAPHAITCIESGYHVIIEKPMALDTTSAEQIIETSLIHKKRVFCIMQNRYAPIAAWLKKIVDSGRLGEIYMVDVQCYWNRDERYYLDKGRKHDWHGDARLDGGPLFTQFSHFVDMVYWLFGNWKKINSSTECFRNKAYTDFEDSGQISFRLGDKTLGSFSYTNATYNQNLLSAMTIIAENGTVRIGGQYMQELLTCDIRDYEIPLETVRSMERALYDNHLHIYENVYEVLHEGGEIAIDTQDGINVVNIIEYIYKKNP